MSSDAAQQFRIEVAKLTDPGMLRANNQDAITVVSGPSGGSRGDVLLVADGMGGHAAGELASQMATQSIPHAYHKQADLPPPAALRKAIRKANAAIYAKGQSSPDLEGMGTTCSCLVMLREAALIAHVGDSRVYRLRAGKLEQLTFDHSLVWEIAAASHTTLDKVPAGIPRNYITRSLGPQEQVNIDVEGPYPLAAGDVFLICSDGLGAVVPDNVAGAIIGAMPPQQAAQTLIDLANLRGGPDNISVIVARVDDRDPADESAKPSDDPHGLSRVSPSTWLALAGSLAAVIWFASKQDYEWALAAAVGLAVGAVVAWLQRGPVESTEDEVVHVLGGPYGDGPYRNYDCLPGRPAVDAIAAVVDELAALQNETPPHPAPPIEDWDEFTRWRQHAIKATASDELDEAVRGFAAAIASLMRQVRSDETAKFPSAGKR
ncbi:MAG: protein phosphatase 2C domain-containing protein [Planctomycetota bacterium]